jgi:hypothetical protein
MKRIRLSLVLGIYAVASHAWSQSMPDTNSMASSSSPHVPPHTANQQGITSAESQELMLAHQEALKANPELQKEEAELQQKIRDFQHKLDQAVLQVDPNVAEVVARIESSRGPHPSMPPQASGPSVSPGSSH